MKTASIMTYWAYNDNYGQILQAYALSTYLKSLGLKVNLIRYEHLTDESIKKSFLERLLERISTPRLLAKIILARVHKIGRKDVTFDCPCADSFMKFKEKYFSWTRQYKTFEDLKADPPESDIYICGSDMIWAETAYRPNPFFLDFGKPQKRIAYAPSFGRKKISAKHSRIIKPLLENFDAISVRETSGIDICNRLGFKDAHWVPDPTLLLDMNDYAAIEAPRVIEDKYIFIYMLGADTLFPLESIRQFADRKGYKIIYRAAQGRNDELEKTYPSPEEWLSLIHHAEHVFTNSFHGSIFSIIYRKQFTFLPLQGADSSKNERIFSILNNLGLSNHIYYGKMIMKHIDYIDINERLDKLISQGKEYLCRYL